MFDSHKIKKIDSVIRKLLQLRQSIHHRFPEVVDANIDGLSQRQITTLDAMLPETDELIDNLENLEEAMAQAATPGVIGGYLVLELYPRCKYGVELPKEIYAKDVCACIKERGIPCSLSVFRATTYLGRRNKFVPPAEDVAAAVHGEECHLIHIRDELAPLLKLRLMVCKRIITGNKNAPATRSNQTAQA